MAWAATAALALVAAAPSAAAPAAASCRAALTAACSTNAARAHSPFAHEPCAVCAENMQRALKLANCSHADIVSYCEGAPGSIPTMMTAAYKDGSCEAPFACVKTRRVPVPDPGSGEALIRSAGSSVNPCDVDYVEGEFAGCSGGGGTLGMDVAGTVVKLGTGKCRLQVGDRVWADLGGVRGDTGGMADYAVVRCDQAGIAPNSINVTPAPILVPRLPSAVHVPDTNRRCPQLTAAATIPLAGLTSVECLQATGAPWSAPNLTVVVTSGTGGTGFIAVQLAKAFGAARVVTSTSGAANIALARSFGADVVTDYKKQDIFAALPDASVDIVYGESTCKPLLHTRGIFDSRCSEFADNFGAPGTADRAMRTMRHGGTILVLPGGESGKISKHPRADVRQITFSGTRSSAHDGLDTMAAFFDAG